MTVTISKSLIKHLSGLGDHFCRVYSKSKKPIGKNWQKLENLTHAYHERLQIHLYWGGNYGVVSGRGLVIVDIDLEELKRIVELYLPPTFTVESPGSHGWHLYFLSDMEKPIRLRDREGENVGDIGKMCIGPGSVHPNGGVYKVIKDLSFARVTRKEIMEAFKAYVVPDQKPSLDVKSVKRRAKGERNSFNIDIDIAQVVPFAGLHKNGEEYYGAHPVHGSKGGQNFWVNLSKNCWHCFRHQSGGGPLLWIAVEEGIISCAEAGPGVLRDDAFFQVLEAAEKRGFKVSHFRQKEVDTSPTIMIDGVKVKLSTSNQGIRVY